MPNETREKKERGKPSFFFDKKIEGEYRLEKSQGKEVESKYHQAFKPSMSFTVTSDNAEEIVKQAVAVYAEIEERFRKEMEQTIRDELEEKARAEFKQQIREQIRAESQGFDWIEDDSSPVLKRSKATPAHENVMKVPWSDAAGQSSA